MACALLVLVSGSVFNHVAYKERQIWGLSRNAVVNSWTKSFQRVWESWHVMRYAHPRWKETVTDWTLRNTQRGITAPINAFDMTARTRRSQLFLNEEDPLSYSGTLWYSGTLKGKQYPVRRMAVLVASAQPQRQTFQSIPAIHFEHEEVGFRCTFHCYAVLLAKNGKMQIVWRRKYSDNTPFEPAVHIGRLPCRMWWNHRVQADSQSRKGCSF